MTTPLTDLYRDHFETMRSRHAAALAACGYDWVVVYSGRPHVMFLDDRTCPFEANPQFRSWLPLPTHSGGAILVGRDGPVRLIYLQPRDYWHLPPADPDEHYTGHFDLEIIRDPDTIVDAVGPLDGRIAMIADPTAPEALASLGELNPQRLIDRLHFERAIKTDYEIECVRRANAIAVRGHRAAEKAFRDGASEFEIHLEYCRACGQDQSALPYDNIIALNGHGSVLHYCDRGHDHQTPRHSFLIDAGAAFHGYAADITRTYSAADDAFAALVEDMHGLQQALCAGARRDVDYVDLHLEANARIAALLAEHGLVSCSAEAALEQGIASTFFPHGLGHFIGTQVHDVGGHLASAEGEMREPPEQHPFLRLTRTLAPGMIFTIEPGIYFIDMLLGELRQAPAAGDVNWRRVEQFAPFGGIRIEDNVLVTADGNENLTRDQFALR